jgi:hypothetical protein
MLPFAMRFRELMKSMKVMSTAMFHAMVISATTLQHGVGAYLQLLRQTGQLG